MKKTLAILLTLAMLIGTCISSFSASAKGAPVKELKATTAQIPEKVTKHDQKKLNLQSQTEYQTVNDKFSFINYPNNSYEVWKYESLDTDVKYLEITFSAATATEADCDFIAIYDSEGYFISEYSGDELSGKTITVLGNSFYLEFFSDRYVTGYGFEITDITGVLTSTITGDFGTGLHWAFDLDTRILDITGTGAMPDFDYDFDTWVSNTPWRWVNNYIEEVIIGAGVTSIGDFAFSDCYGLTLVTIGSDVVRIGQYAFGWCWYLESIEIPDAVEIIDDYAFCDCEELISATIGTGVETIGEGVFAWCLALPEITVADENANFVSYDGVLYNMDMSILVQYPAGLVDEEGWGWYMIPEGVTAIGGGAFYGCQSIYEVYIPDSVTSIGNYAFTQCPLQGINLPRNLTTIGEYAFAACWFYSVNIGSKVTDIGEGAFIANDSMSEVYFAGNAPVMGDAVFDWCGWDSFTIYYFEGKTGFTNPWYGYATEPMEPFLSIVTYGEYDYNYIENGSVVPVKLKAFEFYRKVSYELGYETNIDIASMEWKSSNKKVIIDEYGFITNRGVGARSSDITLTVTDYDGQTYQQTFKIVFYKYSFQLKGLSR